MSYPELLRLALHASETLLAAEQVNIVHRDVKPANIIIDATGNFWLIDFGIARHLALTSLTPDSMPFGCFTTGYAPIEQCRNDKADIDSRADLFALGVTLYESATGVNPYIQGTSDPHVVIRRVSTISLPRLPAPIPTEFADLVASLAQPNCVHRLQTVREAREWIRELCEREGVQ